MVVVFDAVRYGSKPFRPPLGVSGPGVIGEIDRGLLASYLVPDDLMAAFEHAIGASPVVLECSSPDGRKVK